MSRPACAVKPPGDPHPRRRDEDIAGQFRTAVRAAHPDLSARLVVAGGALTRIGRHHLALVDLDLGPRGDPGDLAVVVLTGDGVQGAGAGGAVPVVVDADVVCGALRVEPIGWPPVSQIGAVFSAPVPWKVGSSPGAQPTIRDWLILGLGTRVMPQSTWSAVRCPSRPRRPRRRRRAAGAVVYEKVMSTLSTEDVFVVVSPLRALMRKRTPCWRQCSC